MKCLLLLLAFELVISDKLDRTYLPPSGAKLAGGRSDDLQTPLEFSKETYPGTIQDRQFPGTTQDTITGSASNLGLDDGMSKALVPIITTRYLNDFSQTTSFPTSGYDETELPSRPDVVSYDSFPPKLSDVDSPYETQQSYVAPTISTEFKAASSTNDLRMPVAIEETPGYYYFVPTGLQTFGNDKINQGITNLDSSNDQNSVLIQYPQSNNDYLSSDRQNFRPKTATAKDITPNYQPSTFGYYGGNPMIMTSQNTSSQESGNELTPKSGEYEANLPVMSGNQDKQNFKGRSSVLPFQTPLVGTNAKKLKKNSATTTSVLPPDQPAYKENTAIGLEKRINIPVRSKLRTERPQTESDRNAVIFNYENVISPEGYSYSFDTSNGIHKDESATATDGVKAKGSYSYTGDDGKIYSITYTADENGFQPRGDHLPTPPPIPEAIKKVIEQAARDTAAGYVDDGSYDEKKYGHMNYQGAMGRYRPYKERHVLDEDQKLNGKLSRPNEKHMENVNIRGANTIPANKGEISLPSDRKTDIQLTNKLPSIPVRQRVESRNGMPVQAYTDRIFTVKNQNPFRRRPVFDRNHNQQQDLNDVTADKSHLEPNRLNQIQTMIGPEHISKNQNDAQVRDQPERLIPSVSRYNQNGNGEIPSTDGYFQTQTPDLRFNPNNMNTRVHNQIPPIQVPQINPVLSKELSSKAITSYDNGYLYVPPIVKFEYNKPFNQYSEQPNNKETDYLTTNIPIQDVSASANKSLDGTRRQEADEKQTLTQIPFNKDNIINDSTRKPDITGLNNQDESNLYDDMQRKSLRSDENDRTKLTTYSNDLYSSNYLFTTTPMPPQIPQLVNQATDGYNIKQFYQTTINPTSFDQTLLNTAENRLIIPSGTPRISILQDFVTSTYRPGAFSDGINLELNQSVKIYDVGRPLSTENIRGYPEKTSAYNDGFYTPAIPNEESTFTGTYSEIKGPALDSKVFEEINPDFYSTNGPLMDNTGSTGYYYPNPGLEGQSYYDTAENLNNPGSTRNVFLPGEDTSPTYTTEDQSSTERVIGEDFSGPKQAQRFDPETGYHY